MPDFSAATKRYFLLTLLFVCFALSIVPDDALARCGRGRFFRRRAAVTCRAPVAVARPIASAPIPAAPVTFVFGGKRYTWTPVEGESSEEEDEQSQLELESELRLLNPLDRELARAEGDFFPANKDRKVAKTTIVDGPYEEFDNLNELLALFQDERSDESMRALDPPLTRAPNSQRVVEEMKNVTVTAGLVAIAKEEDNDYHLILAGPGRPSRRRYMTAEISGIPRSSPDKEQLRDVRRGFKQFLEGIGQNVGSSYARIDPPIPVRISGSLFFDISHGPTIGPAGMKPKTVWEIHPVTQIDFQ